MKDLNCLKTIITDNLAVYIDLTNIKSWNLNTGFTSISLSKWNGAQSDNIYLYDFGLTGYDNGRIRKPYDTLSLTPNDTKLKLYRVGYNNETGGTFYTQLGITGVTGASVGNYFIVNGGYLQGFFKLNGYKFELIPARYGSGITIETILNITTNSFNNGYFYLMGARAEDKYIPEYSGESSHVDTPILKFSGVTTSENHYLNNYIETKELRKAISDENYFNNIFSPNLDNGINNNVIGFFISDDNKIGYTRINSDGIVQTDISENALNIGWTIISIVFNPYEIVIDKDVLCCTPSRKGDFTIYVNGRKFWKVEDFDEYYFKAFNTQKEKQLGVPFNVSWGGGSFGLKHSYHYKLNTKIIFEENTQNQINSGFTFINNPNYSGTCALPPITGQTKYIVITGDTTTFPRIDTCDTGVTYQDKVLKIYESGNTIGNTLNEYYLTYNSVLHLLSNRDYTFTAKIYDTGIFNENYVGSIGMFFYGDTPITIVESVQYTTIDGELNKWTEIKYKIRTKDNTGLKNFKAGIFFKSDVALDNQFLLYINSFKYSGSDSLSLDISKNNQLIESTYSTPFIGGIQKLRIYDKALNTSEILHNAKIEAKNTSYKFNIITGGRLINGSNLSNVLNGLTGENDLTKQGKLFNIQLVSTGTTSINTIIPTKITWNIIDFDDTAYYQFTGGSKILFLVSGVYRISYSVVILNTDIGEKLIGTSIVKNGSTRITPFDEPTYVGSLIGYAATSSTSNYRFTVSANDFIELTCFRIGLSGIVETVPNDVWISIEKL